MSDLYALQRANGDWFAFADRGRLRVPVFRNSWDASLARLSNAGMLLFKPVALDELAISDMASGDDNSAVYFWLVANPSSTVSHGQLIEHTELTRLLHNATTQTPVAGQMNKAGEIVPIKGRS